MALDATNVRIGITGAIYKAPPDAPFAIDASSALDSSYVDLGYVSDDGVTEAWDDSSDDIVAWQNATTIRSSTTQSTLGISAMLVEVKGATLQTFHRGSVITSDLVGTGYQMDVKPVVADPSRWVIDVVDGSKLLRVSIGNGEIIERGEIMYANGQAIGLPILIRAYPDENGNLCQKFSNDSAWAEGLDAS